MDAINQYVYRGLKPKPLPSPGPKRISTPAGQRLSTILESSSTGGNRLSNFSLANISNSRSPHRGVPPAESEEKRPPSYQTQDSTGGLVGAGDLNDGDGDDEGKGRGWRDRGMQRGGWGRLSLIFLAVLAILGIALGVGLGVGLHKHSSSSSSSTTTPSQEPFPIGMYAIEAYLINTTTSCTSNSSTWTCYPYSDYAANHNASETLLSWTITSSPTNSSAYQISATANLFSIVFANVSLTLMDENLASERYTFSIPNMVKTVDPDVSLTNNNVRSTCFYNSTTFQASLYTKMKANLSGNTTTSDLWGVSGSAWPGAVIVEQTASGGADVPNCYSLSDGVASGSRIPLATESSSTQCSCFYSNYLA